MKNYARNKNLKTSLTVGVIGLPNVGKSSLINSLKRAKVAQVGNTPGVTRGIQEVHLDKQITLLDSPGVVFAEPSADGEAAAALRNCVKIEQLEDPILPVTEITKRCPAKQLMLLYNLPKFDGPMDLLQKLAVSRGKLKRGGTVDVQAAARILLQDWTSGKIPYYTVPPVRESVVADSAQLVSQYAAEFSLDKVCSLGAAEQLRRQGCGESVGHAGAIRGIGASLVKPGRCCCYAWGPVVVYSRPGRKLRGRRFWPTITDQVACPAGVLYGPHFTSAPGGRSAAAAWEGSAAPPRRIQHSQRWHASES